MSERDTLLAVTTLSFDIAALELFLPLIVGGRVDLIDRDLAADASRLAARLDDPRITFLQATPATWRSLLEAGWRGKPTLTMLCGGEALPRALADRLADKGAALWNLYGPTETTVLVVGVAGRARPRRGLDRAADRQHAPPCARSAAPARPGRRGGRALYRRHRARARLPKSAGPDGRAVRPRPVRQSARRSTLPDGRPCPLAARRDTRMPGTHRSPGQDPRVPRRAGRGRGGAREPPPRPGCGGRRPSAIRPRK